jgi:hypothetical protein
MYGVLKEIYLHNFSYISATLHVTNLINLLDS